jgi:hypothetical protein
MSKQRSGWNGPDMPEITIRRNDIEVDFRHRGAPEFAIGKPVTKQNRTTDKTARQR